MPFFEEIRQRQYYWFFGLGLEATLTDHRLHHTKSIIIPSLLQYILLAFQKSFLSVNMSIFMVASEEDSLSLRSNSPRQFTPTNIQPH